jgi:hypothetical protein
VEKRLRFLEKVAALPPQDPNDPDSQLGPGPPLKLKFTVLRVSLDDPAERLFAAMVAGPKQQEFLEKGISFAGPVFAKGRVLGSWALSELDDTAIEDATLFLIGRCSCRIKNENPGWDVVLKTDWDVALKKARERGDESAESPPSEAGTKGGGPPKTEPGTLKLETFVASAPAPSVPTSPVSSPATGSVAYYVNFSIPGAAVAAGVLAVVIGVAGFMLWFKR